MKGKSLATDEISALLGVRRQTVYMWFNKGLLPFFTVQRPASFKGKGRKDIKKVKASDLQAFRDRWGFVGEAKPVVKFRQPKVKEPPPKKPCADFMTQMEAGRRLGVGQTTVSKWIRNGVLPSVPCPNGDKCSLNGRATRHIDRQAFEKLIEKGGPSRPRNGRPIGRKNRKNAEKGHEGDIPEWR